MQTFVFALLSIASDKNSEKTIKYPILTLMNVYDMIHLYPNKGSHTMKNWKKVLTYAVIMLLAWGSAVNYQLFIFPNKFAPSGLNGLCTMIQYVFGISVSSMNLLINLPLALWVYKAVSKAIAVRSMVYVLTFSAALSILEAIDISALAYATDTGTSTILGPLVAGILSGSVYSLLAQAGAYTGGTDFIASLIRKSKPELNFFYVTFSLNVFVACISYFVYGYQIEPVLLCIMYSFTSSTVSDKAIKSGRGAIRFEIVTDYPQELSDAIITRLHHSATLIPATGMYSGHKTNILICVINKTQVAALSAIIRQYPNTFAVMSSVSEVMGNFKHLDNSGKEHNKILDSGDSPAV